MYHPAGSDTKFCELDPYMLLLKVRDVSTCTPCCSKLHAMLLPLVRHAAPTCTPCCSHLHAMLLPLASHAAPTCTPCCSLHIELLFTQCGIFPLSLHRHRAFFLFRPYSVRRAFYTYTPGFPYPQAGLPYFLIRASLLSTYTPCLPYELMKRISVQA